MSGAGARTAAGWDATSHAGFTRFLEAVAAGPPGSRLERRDGVVACVSPAIPERSLFNSVAYERPQDLERIVDGLTDLYAEAGIDAWTVWVPEADERSARLLASRGHVLDARPRQMRLDLGALAGATELAGPIEAAEWQDLCAVNDNAYGLPAGTFERGLGGEPDPGFRAYGAYEAGRLVSALATLEHRRDCVVFAVATLPDARGRGLAGGLLERALLEAGDRGCLTSTLQATAAGAPVYERLGYRDLGELQMWELRRGSLGAA